LSSPLAAGSRRSQMSNRSVQWSRTGLGHWAVQWERTKEFVIVEPDARLAG
jgi:hypothetical protein